MPIARSRAFAFTINNPSETSLDGLRSLYPAQARYICVAPEVGEEAGVRHLQGFVHFLSAKTTGAACRALGGAAHVEHAAGSAADNKAYCRGPYVKNGKSKPLNPDFEEYGDLPEQGHRSDIDIVREQVKSGASFVAVIEEARNLQCIKIAQVMLPYFEGKRSWKTEVTWLWGPTGTGKSHSAWSEAGAEAYAPVSYKWWDGYDRSEHVVLDDIRPGWASFEEFLRLFDKYPMRIECKGGSRQFLAKKIWVTAPMSPEDFFKGVTDEAMGQITRRIESVKHLLIRHRENGTSV